MRTRLSILCYHGISLRNEYEARPELYVTAAHFRRRLAQLKDGGYTVVQLKDGLRAMHAGTLPPRSVAITFDDGTRDFSEHAVPALREYAMPATVCITTYYADRPLPVFDTAFWYLLWRSADPASATVPHFCYPSGDYDGLFLPWLGAEVIESATTCVPGLASRMSHPVLLPRFLDRADTSDITFDSWLTGIVDFYLRGKMQRLDPERLKVNTNGRA